MLFRFEKIKVKARNGSWPAWLWRFTFLSLLTASLVAGTLGAASPAMAQAGTAGDWYRLRTNSVPYMPQNVTLDAAGGLWVTAVEGSEYEPSVWYLPPGSLAGPFQYVTDKGRNNLLSASSNPPVVKPQLNAPVLHAIRDKGGNTWYALKNRKVLCEKADHTWRTYDMPDSSPYQPSVDTTNVDSAHRIRLIDKPDGSQEKLLIAIRGIVRINAGFSVVETRQVYEIYNNYFIRDALIDSQNRYWVTSQMGVEQGTSLVNTTYVKDLFPADPSAASGTNITRIVEDASHNIWFGSNNAGNDIYCYTTGGQWIKYARGLVNDIAAGNDGSVWFGAVYYDSNDKSTGGVLRYNPTGGGQWTRYTQANLGLDSGAVSSLAVDGTGLWFATAYNPSIPGNGTGVHYLTFSAGQPNMTHYTYRGSSTTLTSLRFSYIAADLSGGVWFPAYDDTSISRLKADGSWQLFRQTGNGSFGSFGFAGVAVDSKNRVYFAPQNASPVAYDATATAEQWVNLPNIPFSEFYYYGVYIDPQDGKWFHGAFGVYHLDGANIGWTRFSQAEIAEFPDNRVDGVLVDDAGNVWFMTWGGIALMKKDPQGGPPTWYKFTSADGSGYTGGYRVYQDDSGQVWNAAGQQFNAVNNSWITVADKSAFNHRQLRFLNGKVPADMDLTNALPPITALEERNMTIDTSGNLYFSGGMSSGLSSVNVGIVVSPPLPGDIDRNGRVDLADAILTAKIMVGLPATGMSTTGDVNGGKTIGSAEFIYILQRLAGLR